MIEIQQNLNVLQNGMVIGLISLGATRWVFRRDGLAQCEGQLCQYWQRNAIRAIKQVTR